MTTYTQYRTELVDITEGAEIGYVDIGLGGESIIQVSITPKSNGVEYTAYEFEIRFRDGRIEAVGNFEYYKEVKT